MAQPKTDLLAKLSKKLSDAAAREAADPLNALRDIANELRTVASAITPLGDTVTKDDTGGYVGSLAEAVVGVTAGLVRIAEALDGVAGAIREHGKE